jgi:hypothetical protein
MWIIPISSAVDLSTVLPHLLRAVSEMCVKANVKISDFPKKYIKSLFYLVHLMWVEGVCNPSVGQRV